MTFIDEFLTEEFCRDHHLFVYRYNENSKQYEISSVDFPQVKNQLLFSLTNSGQPVIQVQDANHSNRGELYLIHQTQSLGLEIEYAQATLENVYYFWKRPVIIETTIDHNKKLLIFDGTHHKMASI